MDKKLFTFLTLYKVAPLKYCVFENIMENGAFAPKEQMLHFPYFQKYFKLHIIFSMLSKNRKWIAYGGRFKLKTVLIWTGVVTVQDSQSGKPFSSYLNLAKNVQKSPIKCLKEQNIHRKQSVYAYLIVNIWLKYHDRFW